MPALTFLRNEPDVRSFTQLVQQTPFFALEIMQILADRLRRNTSS